MIYLDNNATTPVDERVLEAMLPYFSTLYGNPNSVYKIGRLSRNAIDTARDQVAALVNAHPSQVIFTSGGTESNNLAIKSLLTRLPGAIAFSAVEHPAVLEPVSYMLRHKWDSTELPVDKNGTLDLGAAKEKLNQHTRFASVMLANNETGVIQPVKEFVEITKEHKTITHTDAVQAVGKVAVDYQDLGVDFMSLSSHKIYGPKGIGALIVNKSIELEPLLSGGGQEKGLRGGTENVPLIVGFGKACELAKQELNERADAMLACRTALESKIADLDKVTLFSAGAKQRLPNTSFMGVEGYDGETLLMQLDMKGIAVSSGSACKTGSTEQSHVLQAMQVPHEIGRSSIRVSFGKGSTAADVTAFVDALQGLM